MAAWAALPLLVLGAAGLSVESPSPDALCPPLEETRRAVASRLGSVELDGTWRATYVLVHRAQGDFIALELFDPQGALRLERQLPAQGGNCASLPSVIALVLERFFVRPEQASEPKPSEPEVEPSEAAPDAPRAIESAPEPPAVVAKSPEPVPSPPRIDLAPERATEAESRLRVGAELWATNAWLAPGLRLERRFSAFSLGGRAGFDLSQHRTAVFEGSAAVRRIPVSLLLQREQNLRSSFSVHAGLELIGVAEVASSRALADESGGFRVVPGAGLRLGARLFPQARVKPFFELTGAWLMRQAAPAFRVGEREVLSPPSLTVGGAFGLDASFF